jgi:hypothetical protein
MPHQLQVCMPRVLQCSCLAMILYCRSYGFGPHPLASHAHGHAKLMPAKAHVQLESLLGSPAAHQTTWSKPAFGILPSMAQVTPKLSHPIPTCHCISYFLVQVLLISGLAALPARNDRSPRRRHRSASGMGKGQSLSTTVPRRHCHSLAWWSGTRLESDARGFFPSLVLVGSDCCYQSITGFPRRWWEDRN